MERDFVRRVDSGVNTKSPYYGPVRHCRIFRVRLIGTLRPFNLNIYQPTLRPDRTTYCGLGDFFSIYSRKISLSSYVTYPHSLTPVTQLTNVIEIKAPSIFGMNGAGVVIFSVVAVVAVVAVLKVVLVVWGWGVLKVNSWFLEVAQVCL